MPFLSFSQKGLIIADMSLSDLLSISGAVLLSLGGGSAIVFALSKWLGGVWANRILENERASLAREQELLVRRRNVYAKLALSMRVFLDSSNKASADQKDAFLAAYDEAALWGAEEAVAELGIFLDMQAQVTNKAASVSQDAMRTQFVHCMTVMRRDCGFPNTEYRHRVVAF
jgi:hypothetical protein